MADQKAWPLHGSARVVEPRGQVHLAVTTPIKHVVIIVKENHGYDNYFGTFPGGAGVSMPHSPNPPPKDPNHRHAAWLTRDTTAPRVQFQQNDIPRYWSCLLYTSDAADDLLCVDLGGRRIIKKKK